MSCTSIENASNVKFSAGFQTDQKTPAANYKYVSGKSTNVGPGTVNFTIEKEIGSNAPADIISTIIDVTKNITWLGRPNQLKTIATWVFGDPIKIEAAPISMIYITSPLTDTVSVRATAEAFVIIANNSTELVNIPLPATISAVITEINKSESLYAELLWGDNTGNYYFEGTLELTSADLLPAAPYGTSSAVFSVYRPMNGCPKYLSFLYKLFADTNTNSYRRDVGAQALNMSIEMPKDGPVSITNQYFALINEPVDPSLIPPSITASDRVPVYKGAQGLYHLILGKTQYPTIDSVTWSFTNNTTSIKNWYGDQMDTAPKSFDNSMQINAWLEKKLYDEIVQLYSASEENKSYVPTITYIVNQLFVDTANKIPYMFGSIYPKAKISTAPELTVEADSDIPCNFTLSPTAISEETNADSMLFFILTES